MRSKESETRQVDALDRHQLLKLAVVRPPVQAILDRLKDVPVDIEPRFVTADKLP